MNPAITGPTQAIPLFHTPLPDDGMNQFVVDPAFQALHLSLLPLDYKGMGSDITIPAADSENANAYFVNAKKISK